jgi:hypothetical protein
MAAQRRWQVLCRIRVSPETGAGFGSSCVTIRSCLSIVVKIGRALCKVEVCRNCVSGSCHDHQSNRDYHKHQKAERQHNSSHNTSVSNAGCGDLLPTWKIAETNSPNCPPDARFHAWLSSQEIGPRMIVLLSTTVNSCELQHRSSLPVTPRPLPPGPVQASPPFRFPRLTESPLARSCHSQLTSQDVNSPLSSTWGRAVWASVPRLFESGAFRLFGPFLLP